MNNIIHIINIMQIPIEEKLFEDKFIEIAKKIAKCIEMKFNRGEQLTREEHAIYNDYFYSDISALADYRNIKLLSDHLRIYSADLRKKNALEYALTYEYGVNDKICCIIL